MASFPADDLVPTITVAVATHDASQLPAALVSCGVFLVASALGLIVSETPGAVLVTWHGSAAAYAYYAVLFGTVAFGVAEAAFGVAEATFGFWVVPRDLRRWNMAAKVLLYVTLVPLAVVLALWAGLRL